MIVSDIWPELVEVTGTCDDTVNYRALTRAVEVLANEGSFDPLVGTVDFVVDGSYLVALPRDVKTPLRLNINNNPSFARNRIFEFSPNTPGSVDGPEIGWQWHERGYSVVQDEIKLPSKLRYVVTASADVGKTLNIVGTDPAGRRRSETMLGAIVDPVLTKYAYAEIASITREATEDEVTLVADAGTIARYYGDETQPEYRVIKLAKTGVAVRMLYRKHVFKLTKQDDIIPLHSPMAVIRAVEAVRLMQKQKFADAVPILAEAVRLIGKEQSARDEGTDLSSTLEIQTATNTNITTKDALIVADIYDKASDILGGMGKEKIFDRITDAIEVLQNKTQWDSLLGSVDVCRAANFQSTTDRNGKSNYGYFVMPRHVDTVLAVNVGNQPAVPRNQWFEFHLNGPGSYGWVSCGDFHDAGRTCIVNGLPRADGKVTPVQIIAIVDNPLDNGKLVKVFGIERLANGREVEVYRNGVPGWTCPCVIMTGSTLPLTALPADAPNFVRIDRISREATTAFVSLFALTLTPEIPAIPGIPSVPEVPFAVTPSFVGVIPANPEFLAFEQDGAGYDEVYSIVIDVNDGSTYGFTTFHGATVIGEGDSSSRVDNGDGSFYIPNTGIGTLTLPNSVLTMEFTQIVVSLVGNHPIPAVPAVPPVPAVPGFFTPTLLLGYWYPDELAPDYKVIRIAGCCYGKARIRYRKRTHKVSAFTDVINLRSRLAIENMIRAIAKQESDPAAAALNEQIAIGYLEEEQLARNPHGGGTLQFEPGMAPGDFAGIQ